MRKSKQTKRFLFLILIGLFIYSCHEDEKLDLKESIIQSENFVNIGVVTDICSTIEFPTTVKSFKNEIINRNIESITEISDDLGDIVYYITNYENGGFVIISADNRLDPIFAYSESNTFTVNSDDYPKGLVNWLGDTKNKVKKIRKSNSKQKPEIKQRWDELDSKRAPLPGDGDGDGKVDPCEDTHTQVGPLLSTEWWQRGGFNNLVPVRCSSVEEAFAGCVAIAAAQVMRFYEYPDNYDWDQMPNFIGTNETARLIRDIGIAVDMDWTCTGSYAYTSDLPSVLKESFGYTSANYSSFNRNTVTKELSNGRPVILRGQDSNGGHAWVCDGYLISIYCGSSETGGMGASYLSLSMNWGWEDGIFNGFYGYNDWTPGNANLNTLPKMITYIIP